MLPSPRSRLAVVPAVVLAIFAVSALFPSAAAADFLRVPDDYSSISLALGAAQSGDVIGVRGGTYTDSFGLRDGIQILGGFDPTFTERDPLLYETLLRAPGDGRVFIALDVGPGSVLDGFVLTGGRMGQQGGIGYCQEASPTISHCHFKDGVGGAGGSLCLAASGALLFENEFTGGKSYVGGALAILGSNGVVVRGCRFENNIANYDGGAVFTDGSSTRFASCTFIGNQTLILGGSILIQDSNATLDSCVIARSTTAIGGGGVAVDAGGFTTTIVRSTIVKNTGGGVYTNAGQVIVDRSIIAQNLGNGLQSSSSGTITDTCNDVWANQPANYVNVLIGSTSFSLDPLFCDPDQANWRINADSPCAPANSPVCGQIGALPVGCGVVAVDSESESPSKPLSNWLGVPMPHPVTFATEIHYGLADPGEVELAIYDAAGRCMRRLAIGTVTAGEHRAFWDGRDERGAAAAPGVYFYRLAAGGREIGHRKLVIVR